MEDNISNNGNGGTEANGWSPNKGGVVMKIEFDRRILGELHALAMQDGISSVYQMIRNACYAYVEHRTGKKFGRNREDKGSRQKGNRRDNDEGRQKKGGIFGLFGSGK